MSRWAREPKMWAVSVDRLHMDTTMQDIPEQVDGRQLPGFYVDSLTPLVHRRAAEAALLRDRRLELAIDADGAVQARMIDARTALASTINLAG